MYWNHLSKSHINPGKEKPGLTRGTMQKRGSFCGGSASEELDMVSMRMQVWSLVWLSALRVWHCCRCIVGWRCVLDPALLWWQHRLAAAALIWPLAWKLPYATGAALKRKKKIRKRLGGKKKTHFCKHTKGGSNYMRIPLPLFLSPCISLPHALNWASASRTVQFLVLNSDWLSSYFKNCTSLTRSWSIQPWLEAPGRMLYCPLSWCCGWEFF